MVETTRAGHTIGIAVLAVGCLVCACAMSSAGSDMVRVALYNEAACTDPKSREAAWKVMSADPGIQVERVTSETVRSGRLASFDVVVFPGGTGNGLARSLGVEGAHDIERYVAQGHGLIGICAGGYLVVEGWSPETRAIELFNAESWDDEHWARGEGFITVGLVGRSDAESTRTMWFENGPIFVPGHTSYLPAYVPLVRYETDMAPKGAPKGMMTGRDAVIAAEFGRGRCVAFGPHPELSPYLNHWLLNAIRWVASSGAPGTISVDTVLEGPIPPK